MATLGEALAKYINDVSVDISDIRSLINLTPFYIKGLDDGNGNLDLVVYALINDVETEIFRIDESGEVTITGATTISGNLGLTGNLTQTGSIGLTGNITQTGNIGLTGNITQQGSFGLTGNITQTGNIGLTGNITQTGNQSVTGDIGVTGDIVVNDIEIGDIYSESVKAITTSITYDSGNITQIDESEGATLRKRTTITYDGTDIDTINVKLYASDGVTVNKEYTDTITYTSGDIAAIGRTV